MDGDDSDEKHNYHHDVVLTLKLSSKSVMIMMKILMKMLLMMTTMMFDIGIQVNFGPDRTNKTCSKVYPQIPNWQRQK